MATIKLDNSLKTIVTDRLRSAIIAGVHKPGERLVEQTIADELGISRGPVREAFLHLQQEGLIQMNPRRGCVVTPLSPTQAAEIYVLRGHLESLAVRLARPHWTPEDPGRLAALLDRMGGLGPEDWERAIALDREFHHTIVDRSKCEPVIQMYRSIDGKVAACFMTVKHHLPLPPQLMASRHEKLAEALTDGDFWRAEFLAAEHWADTAARFRALRLPHFEEG
ncbi:MAG: Transcriptional regulator, GntR family [Firmicutes bacterium]|nr:Transcriptional regulator, GntR family [Bacillota bacterium]